MDLNAKTSDHLGILAAINKKKIHIHLHRQSARRATTLLQGLDDDLDLNRICKYMKRSFNTNGCVLEGAIIQLQGDFCMAARKWLVEQEVLTESEAKERIVIHAI